MADSVQIARLAVLRETAELQKAVEELQNTELGRLARQSYEAPEAHDRTEWIRLRAYHAGMDKVFGIIKAAQAAERKEER